MYSKFLIFIFTFLFIGSSSNDDVTITWNENKKLSWDDFKAEPKPLGDEVALTASGITFGYSIDKADNRIVGFNTTVASHFYPNKSWYLKDKANTYILGHEQLHFDITELYVRKFRQKMTQLKVSQNIKSKLDNLHIAINKALAETQKQYDAQSEHSMNTEMQSKWRRFVDTELKKLDQFKSK